MELSLGPLSDIVGRASFWHYHGFGDLTWVLVRSFENMYRKWSCSGSRELSSFSYCSNVRLLKTSILQSWLCT